MARLQRAAGQKRLECFALALLKKLVPLLVSIAILPTLLHAQGDASNIPADSLLQRIKSQSVHNELPNWNKVEPEFRARLNKAKSDDAVLNAFAYQVGWA